MTFLGGKEGYFQKLSSGSETLDMTSGGLGEMFEGDSADKCGKKIPLMSLGGRAEGLVRRPGSEGLTFFLPQIFVCCDLNLCTNFITLGQPILGEKYAAEKRKKRQK